jgi:two-component system, sensor histidine kinase and response regulator
LLIANDDPFSLLAYIEQLGAHFDVDSAENGMQAVELVKRQPPDFYHAIILDLNMPIMDGYEACLLID